MRTLYTPHDRALTLVYAEAERLARESASVFVGTPGTVVERTNTSGVRFYVHKANDGSRKTRERYLGVVGSEEGDRRAIELQEQIAEMKALTGSLRLLSREGYVHCSPPVFATLAALHNHGLFDAGLVLIGSHAYGLLLNQLGVRATPYATDDIDLARPSPLRLHVPLKAGLLGVLKTSGIDLVEVAGLRRSEAPTSYKRRGSSPFHIDLVAPSTGNDDGVLAVPELSAHATMLPQLEFLVAESQWCAALSRTGVCRVRVPLPERLATHKLLASRLRSRREAKSAKDVEQACALAAVLASDHPGALTEAVEALPEASLRPFADGLRAASSVLGKCCPAALTEWSEALSARGTR